MPTADGFVWDYEELDSRLAAASHGAGRARLWILCHPQNPTGRVFQRAELELIAELAAKHDLVVVSDEIHAELVHPGHDHVPFAALGADVAARTITVTSGSKAFNLAGLRWAILHAGPDQFHGAIVALPSHYLGTPNLLAVEATDAAWSEGDDWLTAVRVVLDDNRRRLGSLLAAQLPGIVYHPPEATYLAWLDCRALGFGDDPAATFRERGVELAAGQRFGAVGAGFARLNFATSPVVLEAIVTTMADGYAVIGHQPVGGDRPQPAGLEILERLRQLLTGVHDERPVCRHRLADRSPSQQVDVERLVGGCGQRDRVAGAEHGELSELDGRGLGAGRARVRRARRRGR